MLTEDKVITAFCNHLEQQGWTIVSYCQGNQAGIDIHATRDGTRLLVEAKGATSGRDGSHRFGMPFTSSQLLDRVLKGTATTIELWCEHPGAQIAAVFADAPYLRKRIEKLAPAYRHLGIGLYLVSNQVECISNPRSRGK